MKTCGYPIADFHQRAEDLSVDHPGVVQNNHVAHCIALRDKNGGANTEELRNAMVHYGRARKRAPGGKTMTPAREHIADERERGLSTADLAANAGGSTAGTSGIADASAHHPDDKKSAPLFSSDESSKMRSRWERIQTDFVDEPHVALRRYRSFFHRLLFGLAHVNYRAMRGIRDRPAQYLMNNGRDIALPENQKRK